ENESDSAENNNIKKIIPRLSFTEEAKIKRDILIESLTNTGCAEGEELFYPALWKKEYSLFDYLDSDMPVFFMDYSRIEYSISPKDKEVSSLYRKARLDFPVLPPQDISFTLEEVLEKCSICIKFHTLHNDESIEAEIIQSESSQNYHGNINYLKDEIKNLQQEGWAIFIFADNENQALRINEIFKEFVQPEGSDEKSLNNLKPLVITGQAISEGFIVPDLKLKVIQENEIFSRKEYIPKTFRKAKSQVIDTFVEMNPGDYVVHVNYGIAIFLGIERVHAMGNERDYIKLEYADKEFLFVPIEQVNLLQRYIGNEGEAPHLDRIGSKAWENRKKKVSKSVEDIALKLIDLYSKRKSQSGFPFPKDTEWQTAFEAAFPYEDTPDQLSVTEEIKRDMEKPVPMDRLLCGDVGYGKTEIAMRAAFKAVMGGKQVAFLAPTTILAEQHYENCLERFKNFPIKIACLSRFVSPSEQKKIIKNLSEGKVDILVGTHRIIQKDIVFKNLGLMIIDEEQRFGVKDKEKLKTMKTNIDSLAMSATPIPRTLHMSLLKIRDISLLTTPPQSRQSIETVIDAYSDDRVTKAIRREVERGGQVFYLHNRVESLNETRLKLERLMPEMSVDVAHGQMTSEELDDIFRRFKLGGFHILVATTIIENGIDIPNVNTIIIDRADMYGVSQLYQLRGRVGRSDRKAYAYLLYPGNKSLSEIAMKRLRVISDFTELGSGFKIAMKDMEIRGAGNLLGRDQSGSVCSVGFDMYMKLLNEAISRLSASEDFKPESEVLLELEYTGFIPETYVKNPQTKMEIYKKIASIDSYEELDGVYSELSDHFGPVPEEVMSLLALAQIRIICRKLNVSKIKERNGICKVEFLKISSLDVNKVIKLITESAGMVKPDPANPTILYLNTGKIGLKEKAEFIKDKLEKIV
ncbi:MAG: transcription-repair coupling factor, partial [Treponema sp.]|nr:transcription-repair coupling factor [Treponema sp.]